MANRNNRDVVDLRIEATNLASEELLKAADDLQGLGTAAEEAQREVRQLEITRDSIESFREATLRIEELQNEVAQARTTYSQLRKEIGNTKNATREQTLEINRQQQVVKTLERDLKAAEGEYRKLDKSLRDNGINTRKLSQEQESLNAELQVTSRRAAEVERIYAEQRDTLRERIAQQKESARIANEERIAQEKLNAETAKQNAEREKAIARAQAEATELDRVRVALVKYESELSKLNQEKAEGNITTGNYIRKEEQLRKELQLSAAQVTTSRRAIEADAVSKDKASKSTDALTQVTRRLAQVYTTLIAAQTAASAAIGNVQEFGKLESAVINIERTTGLAADQVSELADNIITLSREVTPTATTELLRFAEVAGQLGVKSTADILNIVAAADQLGVATNIAGDEAATLLTRILQVTNEGVPKIQNLASSVVQLGNNFATTEQEIVNFTRNIVTATRDIELSSAGAAALGTALSVTGLQAEASRTAIGRLSQEIRRSVTEGGESLEALANITGLTADEIEANLGERSEKIILAFVEGLARVRDQGGVVLDTLRQFGIDGQEAAAVFGGLASQVDILRDAIDQSNEAYRRGNAQIVEAARAYASQESALGRLNNLFTTLRARIGEAYSPDTDAAIRAVSDGLLNNEEALAEVFKILPQVIQGFSDLTDTFDNLLSVINTDLDGAFGGVVESFTIFFNGLTAGFNTLILAAQGFEIAIAEAANSVIELFGGTPDTRLLDELRTRFEETKSSILRDSDDISDAWDRLSGTSTRVFQSLVDTAEKYKDSIERLTPAQQEQLRQILEQNRALPELQSTYIDLTSALVRVNREREIEAALTESNNRIAAEAAEAARSNAEATDSARVALQQKNDAMTEEQRLLATLNEGLLAANKAYQDNTINIDQLAQKVTALNLQYSEGLAALDRTNAARESEINTTQRVITEISNLTREYQSGRISLADYNAGIADLGTALGRSNGQLLATAQATSVLTKEQADLQVEINKSTRTIQELNIQLQNKTNTEQQVIDITSKLRAEEEKLRQLREDEIRLNQAASATYFELQLQRQQAVQSLQILETQFRTGSLTVGEYTERKRVLSETISDLTAVLGDNTEQVRQNVQAQQEAAAAQEQTTEATRQGTTAVNLYAQSYEYLNQQFDFSNKTSEELNKRIEELQQNINLSARVTSEWWRELAQLNSVGFQREQQIIRETLQLRKWQAQVESGNLSLEQLDIISRRANGTITELGEQQLRPLRAAIADAKREFQDLNETIDDALNDTLDRLDEVRGNQEEIVKRRFEQERRQYEELLRLAQQSGDTRLINNAQAALRNLQEAQRLELANQFGSNNANSRTPRNNNANNRPPAQSTTNQVFTVRLQLPDGSSTNVRVSDRDSMQALLDALERFADISSSRG